MSVKLLLNNPLTAGVLIAVLWTGILNAAEPVPSWKTQSPEELCKVESANTRCRGDCLDGWDRQCFFDAQEKVQFNAKPESELKCFAHHRRSVCTPCENRYEIKIGKSLKSTSCLKFYKAIQEQDKNCKGCLTSSSRGGG